jgi:cyclopropane fatty-acyl-phospholipid synthase-like methyltransferase
MGEYDAVISMQAVHEVRHKQHIPALLAQIYGLLVQNGLFLFCDHYAEPDNRSKNPDLYLTREDQAVALLNARFRNIECVFDKGGMAFWSATKF